MKTLFITDPLENLAVQKDSSVALMLEAERRGIEVYYCQPNALHVDQCRAKATVNRVHITAKTETKLTKGAEWYLKEASETVMLSEFDSVHMRLDPPFNMYYIYATYALEYAAAEGVLVINNPGSVRDYNEKFSVAKFPQVAPRFVVSADADYLLGFVNEVKDVILKPLDGMGGESIYRVQPKDQNLMPILEGLTQSGMEMIMAQAYLPRIAEGDKRVFVIDGKVLPYMLVRMPNPESGRGNLVRGATGIAKEVGDEERFVAEQVGPRLAQDGILFSGLDVIGDKLSEVNVTSPTGMRELKKLTGFSVAEAYWSAVLEKSSSK